MSLDIKRVNLRRLLLNKVLTFYGRSSFELGTRNGKHGHSLNFNNIGCDRLGKFNFKLRIGAFYFFFSSSYFLATNYQNASRPFFGAPIFVRWICFLCCRDFWSVQTTVNSLSIPKSSDNSSQNFNIFRAKSVWINCTINHMLGLAVSDKTNTILLSWNLITPRIWVRPTVSSLNGSLLLKIFRTDNWSCLE